MQNPVIRLKDETDEAYQERSKAALEVYEADLRQRMREPDADGRIVVNLFEPVRMDEGAIRATLSIRPIKVKDVRRARSTGDAAAYADSIVEPAGTFDELTNDDDYQLVMLAVGDQLGKYLAPRNGQRS